MELPQHAFDIFMGIFIGIAGNFSVSTLMEMS
jgi:hypothetical protein